MFLMLSREHGSTETPRDSPKATGLGWKPDLLTPSASPQDRLCPSDHSFLPKLLVPWGLGTQHSPLLPLPLPAPPVSFVSLPHPQGSPSPRPPPSLSSLGDLIPSPTSIITHSEG